MIGRNCCCADAVRAGGWLEGKEGNMGDNHDIWEAKRRASWTLSSG